MKRLYFLLSLVMLALTAGAGTVTDVVTTKLFSDKSVFDYAKYEAATESGSVYSCYAGL